jgi:Kef-type K+ transport system membrane component KefB/mannitol/fructose-specific phosphotransferase system IIA component
MASFSHHEVTMLFFSLAVMLGFARLLGEAARYFHQPAVLGELLAGILLGPTVLGYLSPSLFAELFPADGNVALGRETIAKVGVVLFLLVAGLEVDLSLAFRQRKAAIYVSATGMLIPFALGFTLAYFLPSLLMTVPEGRELVFALFFGTALCISALPVIAKTLLDLNLFKTDMGVVIIASAIIDDLTGWMIFAIILGMIAAGAGDSSPEVGTVILFTLLFAGLMLTVGRWAVHRALPWLQAHLSWPAGVLGFAITFALFFAALTEWIGIHAIFGSFLFGIALGDSRHLRERTRSTLDQFISTVFAPLFFASIGLKVNFIESFSIVPVVVVLVIATLGKVLGCAWGARMAGMEKNEAWAIGFGMNARGAMEIILGLLALQAELIDKPMFVALVIMALVTSMTSGTMMQRLLRRQKPVDFVDLLHPKAFTAGLKAGSREDVIRQMATVVSSATGLDAKLVGDAVWAREQTMPTGLENMIAIPHARLPNLTTPLIAAGVCREGVDFDATDGSAARIIFVILTPTNDQGAQLQILAGLARTASEPVLIRRLSESRNFTEFLATLKAMDPKPSHD